MNQKYKHVQFLINKAEKKGAGVCRNIGLKHAKGKRLIFADSDDFFVKDFYSKIEKYFESNYDVIFFKPTSIFLDRGKKAYRHEPYEDLIENYKENNCTKNEIELRYKFYVPWSKLIKKSLVEKNKIHFDEVIASNDVMFSTKIGYHMKKFEVDNNIIYCVTRKKGSLTTNISYDVFISRLRVYIRNKNFIYNHLPKNELKNFRFNGSVFLVNSIKYKFGIRKIFKVYIILKKNNIKVFDWKFLNPFFIIRKTIEHYKDNKEKKKFYTREENK